MELLRVTNLLSYSVGVGNHVLYPRVEGDPDRPGYRDLPKEFVESWLERTQHRPVKLGWVSVEAIGAEAKAPAPKKEEKPAVETPAASQEAPKPPVVEENTSTSTEGQASATSSDSSESQPPEEATPAAKEGEAKTPTAKRTAKK